ncbi:MAG: 4-(cytidine 5'-diphospho)-2-C-methyl-D-erythritol kinase [Ruminococcaceae bacterium]|nr:4-(cytidine 5'-diphospho)-2-C-methyl-D-erythritol kinase [Oscillospiraceae bacterium]
MKVNAYAKINLTLDVLNKREDGYHEISSVMQTISLCDVLSFNIEDRKDNENEIIITSNDNDLPTDSKNLCHKACTLFFEEFGICGKTVNIHIEKNIPIAAGLGGGSSDCAETLKALNKMLKTNAENERLRQIAVKIGADVPFFIEGGCCKATGIGDVLTPVKKVSDHFIILAKPTEALLSGAVYKDFDELYEKDASLFPKPSTEHFLTESNRLKFISNMLTPVSEKKARSISILKKALSELGAKAAEMTGSGPTVFAVFDREQEAKNAVESLKKRIATSFCGIYKTVNNI